MAAQTRLWHELPYTRAMRGHRETREHRFWAILDGRQLSAPLPFVAHCHCSGCLYRARPGYRPHRPLATERRFWGIAEGCQPWYKVVIAGAAPLSGDADVHSY